MDLSEAGCMVEPKRLRPTIHRSTGLALAELKRRSCAPSCILSDPLPVPGQLASRPGHERSEHPRPKHRVLVEQPPPDRAAFEVEALAKLQDGSAHRVVPAGRVPSGGGHGSFRMATHEAVRPLVADGGPALDLYDVVLVVPRLRFCSHRLAAWSVG